MKLEKNESLSRSEKTKLQKIYKVNLIKTQVINMTGEMEIKEP